MIVSNVNQLLDMEDLHVSLGVLPDIEDHHACLVNKSKVHVCAL